MEDQTIKDLQRAEQRLSAKRYKEEEPKGYAVDLEKS